MSQALGTWIDGCADDRLPVDDRGLQYGDGLFETVLLRDGRARFLDAHFSRLVSGCARLRIRFDALPELQADVARALTIAPARAILKIIVTRGSSQHRGYAPRDDLAARRVVTLWPMPALHPSQQAGVEVRVAGLRLAENPALAGLKHLNRLENVLAAAESPGPEFFESLMLDVSGNLVCGIMSNVFLVHSGRVVTPLVDRCGVAGVMRGIVLRECRHLDLPVSEARLALEDLWAADEVFVTNARIGVVPVRRVGEHSFAMNVVAARLQKHIESLDA